MGATRQQLPTEEDTDLTAGADLKKGAKNVGSAKKYMDPPPLLLEKGQQVEVLTQEEGFSDSWYLATVIDPPSPSSPNKSSAAVADFNKYYVEYDAIADDNDTSCPLREFVDARLVRPLPPTTPVDYFSVGDTVDAFYYDGWWVGVVTEDLFKSRFKVKFEAPPVEQEFHFSELRIHLDRVNDQWLKRPNQAKEKGTSNTLVKYVRRRRRPPKVHESLKSGDEKIVGVRIVERTEEKEHAREDIAPIVIELSDTTESPHESSESGDKCTSSVGTAKGAKEKSYATEDIASIPIRMSLDERINEYSIRRHSLPKESQTFISDKNGQVNVSAAPSIKKSAESGSGKKKGTSPELLEPRGRMDIPTESGVFLMETEVDAIATNSTPEIDLDVNQTLPFKKTTAFWDSIKSMDVFRIFPQNPHFHTLENSDEDCREGLALGQMVTFSRIVKRVSVTYADMSKASMEECLETLVVLEDNGFDVSILRDRLNELIFKKDKQGALGNDLKERKIEPRKRKQRPMRLLSSLI